MNYKDLNNYVPNDPTKHKQVNCQSCSAKNLKTYFICENKGCTACYSCMIRYNGYRICSSCYDSIVNFPKTASSTETLFKSIFGDSKDEKTIEAINLEDDKLIDEIAGAIIALLNEDNNINIVDGKLSQNSLRDINNSVINLISHPDL